MASPLKKPKPANAQPSAPAAVEPPKAEPAPSVVIEAKTVTTATGTRKVQKPIGHNVYVNHGGANGPLTFVGHVPAGKPIVVEDGNLTTQEAPKAEQVVLARTCGGTVTADKHELDKEIESLLLRRRRQFLVHSFLYYELNQSIIDDGEYDKRCKEMVKLQADHPIIAERLPFHDLCTQADGSASGFFLRRELYPDGIITTAFHLLASHLDIPLTELITRYPDYSLLAQNTKRKRGA